MALQFFILLGLCGTHASADSSLQSAAFRSKIPILFSRKAWLFGSDEEPSEILQTVEDFVTRSEKHPYEKIFAKHAAVSFVYSSNKMERTLPNGVSEQDTFQCLESLFENDKGLNAQPIPWSADGGDRGEMRAQMIQHGKALLLANEWSRNASHKLDFDAVCCLHKVLMLNSVDEKGHPVKAGEIRTLPAFTTGHVYPDASRETLERAIQKYYESIERKEHFLLSAATLFYQVIQAHPFQDGNGRLCRLLLNYALGRAGFPFAVPLTSGHSKARKHYILAILAAQYKDTQAVPVNKHLVDLTSLILKSCYYKVINYEANKRRVIGA